MKLSISQWNGKNQHYVLGKWHETKYFLVKPLENRDYVLGKHYEMEYFLVKPVKNWDYIWNWLSRNCVYLSIWNSYNSNFHKKRISKLNLKWYFFEIHQFCIILMIPRSCIVSYHILSVSCTEFAILPMPEPSCVELATLEGLFAHDTCRKSKHAWFNSLVTNLPLRFGSHRSRLPM
jgi:hypothetical protein